MTKELCTRHTRGTVHELLGRESVFDGVADFAYTPRDARVQIASGAEGRFALAGARCERRLPARYGPAPEVPLDGPNGSVSRRVFPSREGGSDVLARICFHPVHVPVHVESTEGYR